MHMICHTLFSLKNKKKKKIKVFFAVVVVSALKV